ncbi:protein tyrosine/serine phosphatase [Prauserella rugosa]|uniref:Protein tyrosine/serine phosphatase n=1 Tax=Prauserella rugosa TaxID=43354 RepID=A0A660CA74_9PSEU|nr:protein tyrosine/serine phosphatase [Prauserella rugosa]
MSMNTCYPALLGFREVSGQRSSFGGQVRSGVLYRSGTPQFLDYATALRLLRDTSITATVDLRLQHEVEQEGRGPLDELGVGHLTHAIQVGALVSANSAVAPMTGDDPVVATYLRYLDEGPEAVAGAIADIVQLGGAPVLVHCTVGKDRTGVIIAMALAAVGVDHDEIATEYGLLANQVEESMQRLRGMKSYGDAVDLYPPETFAVEPGSIIRFLDAVDHRHGGTREFLLSHGFTHQMLEELEESLLDRTVI